MAKLDKSLPYHRVIMVLAKKTITKEIECPDGYHMRSLEANDKEAWANLHVETNLFDTKEEALKTFEAMEFENKDLLYSKFVVVTDADQHIVASAGLWPGTDFSPDRLRLHYVSVSPQAQHKHIAQAMISHLAIMYDQEPTKYPLYLVTQSQSYAAIRLYSHMEFTPYLGQSNRASVSENEYAWQEVEKILADKY